MGRGTEREILTRAWKEAATAARRVALVAGEPGIGKTRLAAEVASCLHADEAAGVLYGRCDEDLGVPYQPFVEALQHFARCTPGVDLPSRLGRYGGDLVRLVPELAGSCSDLSPPLRSDPETERYRLFDAVAGWLSKASMEAPILLVVDDLQWATKPSLLLLRHVVRSPEPMRLLVVGTYRDTEVPASHPLAELLADLRTQEGVVRLALSGLDESGVVDYVEATAGRELDDDERGLARAIHAPTEGNPFFVGEVLRHLAETGAVSRRDGRWRAAGSIDDLGIPEGVREVITRRLTRLSDAANEVLILAAVAGDEFELALLEAASCLDDDSLLAGLEEATSARLVVELAGTPLHYRFAHALVRTTLYQALPGARRARFHRRIGEALETTYGNEVGDHLPALAHHFGRASGRREVVTKAIEYAARAGDRALAQLAHDEAARYYAQALALLDEVATSDDGARRQQLLIALGDAQRRAGDPRHRDTLLDAARLARQRQDGDALARAALASSRGILPSFSATVDEDQVAVFEAALAANGSADTTVRARLLAALALELVFAPDIERRLTLSDEALTLARRLDDSATLAAVLLPRYPTVPWSPLPERAANAEEAIRLTRALQDPAAESRALSLRFRAAMEAGDVAEAERCFRDNEGLVAGLGEPGLQWVVAVQRAGRALLAGRFDEAEQSARAAFALGEAAGQLDAQLFFAVELFALRFEQARTGELADLLDRIAVTYPRSPIFQPMAAVAKCEAGRYEEACASLHQEAADAFRRVTVDVTWLAGLCLFGDLAAALQDGLHAATLVDLLAPHASSCPTLAHGGIVLGSTSHHLGLLMTTLGDHEAAEAHFVAAAETHARIGAPAWLARTHLEWARMLLTRRQPGDAERARELLGQALSTARELGLANVERRAIEVLAR
ncbi:MAG: AAA family ATPase [Actinomycetota bacterium]|nr:AAA family ATPase [Actinomycetota bacterium]